METNRTNTQGRSGALVGHGLYLLGQFMAEHRLPAPHDVLIDENPLALTVALRRDTWQAWLDAVEVLEQDDDLCHDKVLGEYVVTHWKVRLDTGLMLTLRARRDVPLLQAVSA